MRFRLGGTPERLRAVLGEWLSEMTRQGGVTSHAEAVYEPEEHRFGGSEGMSVAHGLWSADAECVLEYECLGSAQKGSVPRAALWATSVNHLLRLSLEDTAEIWDVWCRVAHAVRGHEVDPGDVLRSRYRRMAAHLFVPSPQWLAVLRPQVRHLTERGQAATIRAAENLNAVIARGALTSGRRAWLAANALFQANRWGLGLDPANFCAVTRAMEQLLRPDRPDRTRSISAGSSDAYIGSSRTTGT